MIDRDDQLTALLPAVRHAPWVALDTEADSLHAYPEKLCLLQLSLPGKDVLIDPLAGLNLETLLAALRPHELILHGADYDLRLLHRAHGFVPSAVFDTMLAARLLGQTAFGLVNLVGHYLGVHLEKGPQKANWARRPLTERMAAYARNDTRHLQPLADLLRAQLAALGRLEWHRQGCAQLVTEAVQVTEEDPDLAWRLKGANRLERRALGVVRELWHWREREAIAANRPPFFVLSHETLLRVASLAGHGHSQAAEQALPRGYAPRRRAGALAAVTRALALAEEQLPTHLRHRGEHMSAAAKKRFEALRVRRDAQAAKLQIDPTLIASRAMLAALARSREEGQAGLLPWQAELLAG